MTTLDNLQEALANQIAINLELEKRYKKQVTTISDLRRQKDLYRSNLSAAYTELKELKAAIEFSKEIRDNNISITV